MSLADQLCAALRDGRICEEEVSAIAEFAAFLSEAGPPPRAAGHDPVRYGAAVEKHRAFLLEDR